jgi:hypothetical protein
VADVIPVNPILESISSGVSALPLAVAAGAQVSSPREGGFAVTLAAAQGLSAPSSLRSSPDGSGEGEPPRVAGESANPQAASPAGSGGQTHQPKKSSNGSAPMSANIVPAPAALTASAIPDIALPVSLAPSPSVAADPAIFATVQNPGIVTGNISAVAGTGGGAAQPPSKLSTSLGVALPTTASTLTDDQARSVTGNSQSFSFFSTAERQLSTVITANAASGAQQKSFETEPAPTLMAANVQPSLISFASGKSSSVDGQPAPSASSTNATSPIPAVPNIPAEPIVETAQVIAAALPGPTSSANGVFAVGRAAVAQPSQSAASNAVDANEVSAVGTEPAAQQNVGSDAGDQLAAIVNASAVSSPIVSTVTASLPVRAAARPVVSKAVAEDATANHGAASTPTSASSSGSNSAGGGSAASQTPFAVFFSDTGAGAGAEGAFSALPKMILPVNAAGHASSAVPSVATSGNTSDSVHSNAAQPVAAAGSGKQTPSGSQTENSLAATPHKDADANATNATTDPAPTLVAPVPAAPAPAPVAVVGQSSLPATPGDGLPKADPSQAGAENSATPVPVTPQAVPVALPGPVQMAQMVSRVGQAEMRIGMTTSAFGSVEVRTVIHASDVGVIIGSEKGDLRTLLANEMPVITNSLQQQSLRLNSVNFMQGFAFSNNASGGESQQRSFSPAPSPANPGSANPASSETPQDDSLEAPSMAAFRGGASSLSILA